MTASADLARLAQTRLCSICGRFAALCVPASERTMSLGWRTYGTVVYTAATVAMRLVARFSPLLSRRFSLCRRRVAALRVAGRRPSWRITTPLPSTLMTRIEPVKTVSSTDRVA